MTAIHSDRISLDTCVTFFLAANQLHATVWLQEDKTSTQRFSVTVPKRAQRTVEESKKAFDNVLAMLTAYKPHIRSDEVTHVQFLTALPQTFRKFRDAVDIKGLNDQIQLILSASHPVLPQQQASLAEPSDPVSLAKRFRELEKRAVERAVKRARGGQVLPDQPPQPCRIPDSDRIFDSSLLATVGAKMAYAAIRDWKDQQTAPARAILVPTSFWDNIAR